jgi:hypothetical protein
MIKFNGVLVAGAVAHPAHTIKTINAKIFIRIEIDCKSFVHKDHEGHEGKEKIFVFFVFLVDHKFILLRS